jgi:tetratricopeptide (TPR) repeat protein
MPPPTDPCPDPASLRAFHLGDLPEDALDRLARHLDDCATCSERVALLDEEADPLLEALRLRGGDPATLPLTRADAIAPARPHEYSPVDAPGYEILAVLGSGGMGVVHKARHLRLGRLVALKRLKADSRFDLDRFRREAESVAALQHPNVVQIYEVGDHDGRPFLALEYVDGGALSEFLRGRPQPPRESAALVEDLAGAVEHAHRRGVVHRDLKPANILLQRAGEAPSHGPGGATLSDYTPKVGDFGIAKRVGEAGSSTGAGPTLPGSILGTPGYMAPEQAEGRAVGPAADVYALGAILYELLTGRPPFQGGESYETLRQVVHDDPVPPSRLRPGLSRDLETVCLKCLRKDPSRRYGSAADLAADLRRFLDGRPVVARPVPAWEAAWKWARRRPATAAALLAAQASLVVIAAGAAWYNARLRQALSSTRAAEAHAEESARLALDAHSQLVGQVQSLLQEAPATRALRKALLETAVAGLRRVTVDDASAPRVSTAKAHRLLGEVHWELGHPREAIEEMTRCRRIAAGILASQPDLSDARDLLAASWRRLSGFHLRGDDPALARHCAQEAVSAAEAWRAADPDDPRALAAVIEGYEHLGHAAHWVRDLTAARSALGRMRDLTEAWLADDPDNPRASQLLGSALDLLAGLDETEGDVRSALEKYRRSLELALADERRESTRDGGEAPGDGRTFRNVMVSLNNLAIAYVRLRDFAHARPPMDDALARAKQWAGRDPEDVQRQLDLVDALYTRSAVEQYALNYADALPFLDECRALLLRLESEGKLEGRPMYSVERRQAVDRESETCRLLPRALADDEAVWSAPAPIALSLAKAKIAILLDSGHPDAATATVRGLLRFEPKDANGWLDLARICSRVADLFTESRAAEPPPEVVRELLDRGLLALGRVFELSDRPPTVEELQGDEDLSALRRSPGYDDLLAREAKNPRPTPP